MGSSKLYLVIQSQRHDKIIFLDNGYTFMGFAVVVVALLFYVHGKHLKSCRDGQLT